MWLPGIIDTFLFWFKKILIYYLIVHTIKEPKDVRRLIWVIIFSVIVMSLLGWDLYLHKPELMEQANRLQSLGDYNQPNSFALLLAVCMPLIFLLFEVENNILIRLFLIMVIIFIFISCIFTKSRGGSIGLITGVIMSLMFSRRFINFRAFKITLIGIIIIIFLSYGIKVILDRSDISDYRGSDPSAGDRLLAWKAGLLMWIDHPIFGVGWRLFSENVRDYGHDKKIIAHNTPISVLAETGTFGFIFFMAVLYYNFKQLFQMRRYWLNKKGKEDFSIFSQGVLISLICFMINTSFSVKDHDPIYWMILSLSGVLCGFYIRDREAERKVEFT